MRTTSDSDTVKLQITHGETVQRACFKIRRKNDKVMKNVILETFLEKWIKFGYVKMSEGQSRKEKRISKGIRIRRCEVS